MSGETMRINKWLCLVNLILATTVVLGVMVSDYEYSTGQWMMFIGWWVICVLNVLLRLHD
jgi:hypothetical protein